MTEIKRFDMRGNTWPSDDGSIVSYKDHAAIVAEKDAKIAALQEQVRALAAENIALKKFCINAAFDADYEAEIGMARGGFTDALNDIKTPATNAALREIRAQAVDSFSEDCKVKSSKESHVFWMDASSAAEEYAARIRSGEES